MLWINTVIALFLGGFIGTLVGVEYHLPIAFSMIVGAVVGGLAYKPRELARFAKIALEKATRVNYWSLLRNFCRTLAKVGAAVMITVTVFLGMGISMGITMVYFAVLISFFSGIRSVETLLVLALLPSSAMMGANNILYPKYIIPKFWKKRRIPLYGPSEDDIVSFRYGFLFAEMGLLCIPLLLTLALTRGLPTVGRKVRQLWFDIPDIALYFARLAATHDRITVMASAAVGVALGAPSGRAVVGGITAVAVGTTAVWVSKYMVKRHSIPATGSA